MSTSPRRSPLLAVGALVTGVLVPGCGAKDALDDAAGAAGAAGDAVVAGASESVESSTYEGALVVAALAGVALGQTADEAAGANAGAAQETWDPAGCVATVADGARVQYTLTDCRGPYGLVAVDGTFAATLSVTPQQVGVALTSTDLSVNQVRLAVDATGAYVPTLEEETQTLSVTTRSAATGPRGVTVERSGDYTLSYTESTGCIGIDGDFTTAVAGHSWTTAVTGYERCGAACPKAGGTVVYAGSGAAAPTFDIAYSGGPEVTWQSSAGQDGAVRLGCAG